MEQAVELTREVGTAILLVSHDLGMVAQYAERSVVLKGGRVMDQGDARQVLLQPRVDYTRTLLDAFPERALAGGGSTRRSPLVRVRNIDVAFRKGRKSILSRKEYVRAVRDVSFDIRSGEVLAVVGESGSGKSTVGKALVDLYKPSRGEIVFASCIEQSGGGKGDARTRPQVQMIFQDAGGSLDPRMTIKQAVAEPLRAGGIAAAAERLRRAKDMLAEVGLGDDMHDCYPHQLSGGQRQRVGIARAIVGGGDLIVADEPVSALDVSIQRQILDLLKQLHSAYGLTYLFISHDLDVVEELADRVMVMQRGCLVEIGSRDAVFDDPRHPYTRALLEATPRIRRVAPSRYALATLTNRHADPPSGHRFDVPVAEPPEHAVERACMVEVADDHFVRCIPSVE
jgi:peptide/nickel transport system ATP-binding protein